ncbi:MAG: ATP-binding cassette domain-containing protein, partial [Geminicoccales bacterium]
MLSIAGLSVAIGRIDILHDVALDVPTGATAGLIGRNGAGKTTLMRAIMGLLPAKSGRVVLEDREVTGLPPYRRARLGIGYMPEDRRLVPALAVEENVLLPAWATGHAAAKQRLDLVYGLMPEVAAFAARKALQLSGGQQKLVALARALICGTKVLL